MGLAVRLKAAMKVNIWTDGQMAGGMTPRERDKRRTSHHPVATKLLRSVYGSSTHRRRHCQGEGGYPSPREI